jgi:hypothetical protein
MKTSDQYHKWVEWSTEDETYIGKCPALITGIHDDDPFAFMQSSVNCSMRWSRIFNLKDVPFHSPGLGPCRRSPEMDEQSAVLEREQTFQSA